MQSAKNLIVRRSNQICQVGRSVLAMRAMASSAQASTTATPFSDETQRCINLEDQYGAHNYHPLPVVLAEGRGTKVYDVDGREYYDVRTAPRALGSTHKDVLPRRTAPNNQKGTCLRPPANRATCMHHTSRLGSLVDTNSCTKIQ